LRISTNIYVLTKYFYVIKYAFNASFERICLSKFLGYPTGIYLNPTSWRCTMVASAYLGLPLSLQGVGSVLSLDKQKLSEGKDLIKYFCVPCTPTKSNGGRTRNLPMHDSKKWCEFKKYNLRHIGVDVYFEEQNIHTISSDGELMITILASYAQEESRQVSENMKWRIRKNFEEGKTWNSVIYGYSYDDGIFKIIPHEAHVVRLIYDYYLSGMGVGAVTKKINEEGYLTRKNKKWNKSSVRYILTNYNYTGNLILQKTYTENHLTKKKKLNNGYLPKYHVKESHEAIVSVSEYRKVQEELKKRDSLSGKRRSPKKYPFTGMIVCDKCGTNYRRKTTPYKHVWQCNNHIENGKVACDAKQVPEEILFEVSTDILELEEFNEDTFKKNIRSIKACDNNELVFTFNDETEVIKKWQNKPRSESWTKEKRELARLRELKRRGEINGKNYSNSTNN
jgi:DNA invertase Pin-like site-specific DNA recombinase